MSEQASDTKKSYERHEIQEALEPVIAAKLAEMGIPVSGQDGDHSRRTVRSLLRYAAKLALAKGCPPQFFLNMAMEAFVKEAGVEINSKEDLAAVLAAKAKAHGAGSN